MKYLLLAALMFALGVLLASFDWNHRPLTPLVRVRTNEGLFVTLAQDRTATRSECDEAVGRFVRALGEACPACTVESSECSSKLEGLDGALARGEDVPMYTVSAQGMRFAMVGPPLQVRAQCEEMAREMVRRGVRSAACVLPHAGIADPARITENPG